MTQTPKRLLIAAMLAASGAFAMAQAPAPATQPAAGEASAVRPGPGGKRMDRLVYYFSSTEMDEKNAYTTHMGIEPPYVIEIPKYNKFLVRAVHAF